MDPSRFLRQAISFARVLRDIRATIGSSDRARQHPDLKPMRVTTRRGKPQEPAGPTSDDFRHKKRWISPRVGDGKALEGEESSGGRSDKFRQFWNREGCVLKGMAGAVPFRFSFVSDANATSAPRSTLGIVDASSAQKQRHPRPQRARTPAGHLDGDAREAHWWARKRRRPECALPA